MTAASSDSSSVAGKPLGDQRRNLAALAQAQSEFALHGVADEVRELNGERLIETEIGAQLLALRRGRVLAEDVGHRVADILEQHERDEGHREHHERPLERVDGVRRRA